MQFFVYLKSSQTKATNKDGKRNNFILGMKSFKNKYKYKINKMGYQLN